MLAMPTVLQCLLQLLPIWMAKAKHSSSGRLVQLVHIANRLKYYYPYASIPPVVIHFALLHVERWNVGVAHDRLC